MLDLPGKLNGHFLKIHTFNFITTTSNIMRQKAGNYIQDMNTQNRQKGHILGWSEKHKMQQFKADSEPRHSTDFRTIFGIMIG